MEGFNEIVKSRLEKIERGVQFLANKLNVTPQHVYSLLRGDRRWNETLIIKTCEELGIDISYKTREASSKNEKNCTV